MFPLNPEPEIRLQAADARRALEHFHRRADQNAQRESKHHRRNR